MSLSVVVPSVVRGLAIPAVVRVLAVPAVVFAVLLAVLFAVVPVRGA
ncbi:hypothetical protein [Streptomyces longisporoflavus]|nr:hypothetical protein [Streptomyces longisporoflavus]